jgi:hypothetical protein
MSFICLAKFDDGLILKHGAQAGGCRGISNNKEKPLSIYVIFFDFLSINISNLIIILYTGSYRQRFTVYNLETELVVNFMQHVSYHTMAFS